MQFLKVKKLKQSIVLTNNGLEDGLYSFGGIFYSSIGGIAMILAIPYSAIIDSTVEIKEVQTSGVSEDFVLKAMCITRGDKLSDIRGLE